MSTEQNKAKCRRLVAELFNKGNKSVVDELLSADFIEHEELPPGVPSGREGLKELTAMMRNAFTDFHATIEDLVAEGDKVVIRMSWSGRQTGEFMEIPASGKHFSFGVIDILRFDGDKVVEHWGLMDNMGLLQQLGAMPTPAQA